MSSAAILGSAAELSGGCLSGQPGRDSGVE